MIKKTWILIAVVVLIALVGLFVLRKKPQTELQAPVVTKKIHHPEVRKLASSDEYRGPLDDCLQSAFIYLNSDEIVSECTLNYVHFYAVKPEVKKLPRDKSKLRIGSFNVYHLGDDQAPMKNLTLVAEIMNQWDLVGATELMPLPSRWAESNSRIYQMVFDKQAHRFPQDWTVINPGYLALLKELLKLDSSWALIMQPFPEGEGKSGEMAGFYYRSSLVQPKEWTYCDPDKRIDVRTEYEARNIGCLVKVSEAQSKLISRRAFTTYFQAENFDFVAMTTHVRFRPDEDLEDRGEQENQICARVKKSQCTIATDKVGRYYEVMAMADQVNEIKKAAGDLDVLYMGDFNLEIKKSTLPIWQASLSSAPHLTPWYSGPTTLSVKGKKLNSNYDHFILDRQLSAECDTKSIRAFNFMKASSQSENSVLQKIAEFLDPNSQQNLLNLENSLNKNLLVSPTKKNSTPRPLSAKEKKELFENYNDSIKRMEVNQYGTLLELISDHLPIEMTCRTNQPDDD